jgi:tetratricopeptide (TPR) repeat protein
LGLACVFLFLVSGITYLNADHDEFLFDSGNNYLRLVKQTDGPFHVIGLFFQGRLNPDAPLTFVTFAWNYYFNRAVGLDGFDITSYLIFNVLIHGLNACLVLVLLRRLCSYLSVDVNALWWLPLVLAILFAVHPLQASSVAYIIQRRGMLSSTFYLLAVLDYLYIRRGRNQTPRWPAKRIVLTALLPVLYWLSFRSKNLGITLPFALLAVEFCLCAGKRETLKRYLYFLIPAGVLSMVGMFFFLWTKGLFDPRTLTIHYFGPETKWGPWTHLLTESRVFWHYWKLLFLPIPQWCCVDHDFNMSHNLFEHGAIWAMLAHGLLIGLAIWAGIRKQFLFSLGVLWFYVALMPYAALPQREFYVEYKTYLPSVGWLMILGQVALWLRKPIPTAAIKTLLLGMIVLMFYLTVSRNSIYQDPIKLWSDAAAKNPHRLRSHYNLGNSFRRAGRYKQAVAAYHRALSIDPEDFRIHLNLGATLASMGQIEQAFSHYNKVLKQYPSQSDALNNTAWILAAYHEDRYRNGPEAVRLAEAVNRLTDNQRPSFLDTLAAAYAEVGRFEDAVRTAEKALSIARLQDLNKLADDLTQRLEQYRRKQPWRW